jgi:hypothetical protein
MMPWWQITVCVCAPIATVGVSVSMVEATRALLNDYRFRLRNEHREEMLKMKLELARAEHASLFRALSDKNEERA